MFGVSHGAIQFMTYEEMKNKYNQYRNVPIDTKMVRIGANHDGLTHSIKLNEQISEMQSEIKRMNVRS